MFVAVLLRPALTSRGPIRVAGLGAALLTVTLSGSRAAIAATVIVLLLHAVIARGKVARYAYSGLGLLALFVVLLPQARDRFLNTGTVTGRSLQWQETLRLGGDHLLTGVGPSRYVDAIGRYQDQAWVRRVGVADPPDSPHSWPLQALASGGVPLLVVAVCLSALIAWLGWRAIRRSPDDMFVVGAFSATIAYGLALLTAFTIAGLWWPSMGPAWTCPTRASHAGLIPAQHVASGSSHPRPTRMRQVDAVNYSAR